MSGSSAFDYYYSSPQALGENDIAYTGDLSPDTQNTTVFCEPSGEQFGYPMMSPFPYAPYWPGMLWMPSLPGHDINSQAIEFNPYEDSPMASHYGTPRSSHSDSICADMPLYGSLEKIQRPSAMPQKVDCPTTATLYSRVADVETHSSALSTAPSELQN
eukprot:GEMP01016723.1.p1 GENE.GEMP01016723.1~~GEMP01016723.1.p1  ORF type:complete len:159 (+),score=28.53 GEMP01016723.1:224-700(+)